MFHGFLKADKVRFIYIVSKILNEVNKFCIDTLDKHLPQILHSLK